MDSGGFCWAPSSSHRADLSRAGAGAGGVPWDDERRVLMRRRVSYARRVRPSRPVTRPPLVSRRGVSPRARVKNWRARKLQLFLLGCQTFHNETGLSPGALWFTGLEAAPDETSVSDPRVHSRRASCAVRKRGVRPRRAHSTTSVCGAPAVLDPSKTSPNLHRASLPDAPTRIRASPAGYTPLPHVTRRASPRPEASRSRARAPRSRVFKPRREPPLTRHAHRGSARDDRRTMGLMCANPACTRGVRPKPPPRVPNSPPLGPHLPPRRPKGAHLQKPNGPKTK